MHRSLTPLTRSRGNGWGEKKEMNPASNSSRTPNASLVSCSFRMPATCAEKDSFSAALRFAIGFFSWSGRWVRHQAGKAGRQSSM